MKNKGFTLTELMITLVILVVAGGAVISMFIFSSKGQMLKLTISKQYSLYSESCRRISWKLFTVTLKRYCRKRGRFAEPDDNYYYEVEYSPVKGEELLYNGKDNNKMG